MAALRGAEGEVARGEFAVESNGAVEVSGSGPSSPMLISSYTGVGNVHWPVGNRLDPARLQMAQSGRIYGLNPKPG